MDGTRRVTLELVSADGRALGELPEFEAVATWPEFTDGVVDRARELFGVEVTVLRLIADSIEPGEPVRYTASASPAPPGLAPCADRPDDPRRVAWARPGGPESTLAWAAGEVGPFTGPPVQLRTWALSSIWRLPVAGGDVWLKQVPWFFAHEGAVLRWMSTVLPGSGPEVLASRPDAVLMAPLPGVDGDDADLPARVRMLDALVRLQVLAASAVPDLLAAGVPDRRAPALIPALADAVSRWAPDDPVLSTMVADLPARLSELAACGLPDTLVHGDFHAGNARLDGDRTILMDWGDSTIAHPALDLAAFLRSAAPADRPALTAHWAHLWRSAVPGSDPDRALSLATPLAALNQAAIYDAFVQHTEPSEHVHHLPFTTIWLRRTVETLRAPLPT